MPTPDPAKRPIRCPWTSGSTVSKTDTPVDSRGPSRARFIGSGAACRSAAAAAPWRKGRPSIGAPKASTTRPIQLSHGLRPGSGTSATESPSPIPSDGP